MVKRLNEKPDVDIIYSDEDKIDHFGNRIEPYFKPDWSPDLFLTSHYMTHFIMYRKKILEKINGFRGRFDGSQDFDLALRSTELTQKIEHIPKILYGWRKIEGSAASSLDAKPTARINGLKALEDTLRRRKIPGYVEYDKQTAYYRIHYKFGNPKVSIIIATKDNVDLLKQCILSIENKTKYKNYEIIIIDHESKDPNTIRYLKSISYTVIKFNGRFNYSKMANLAAKKTIGEYLLFLNDDTEVINEDWLDSLLESAYPKHVGIVGCLLLYPKNTGIYSGTIQHAGVIVGVDGLACHAFITKPLHIPYFNLHLTIKNYSAVTGACMLVKRRVFEEVDGWDENIATIYNDIDFCLRVRDLGYYVAYTPYAKLYHYETATRGKLHPIDEEKFVRKKWSHVIKNFDMFYNPNFSHVFGTYRISPFSNLSRHMAILLDVYLERPDLQIHFPEVHKGDYSKLLKWTLEYGVNIDPSAPILSFFKEEYKKLTDL